MSGRQARQAKSAAPQALALPTDIAAGGSVELLKELHILTRDGRLNQDSRRKLKQVEHLARFIEQLIDGITP